MQRLLYCSESSLDPLQGAVEIPAIISEAKQRNGARGISGALISTNRFFAQALEGEAGCVTQLMQSICRDPRHHRVTVVHRDNVNMRRFAGWEMAYRGDAGYINKPIEILLAARAQSEKADAVEHIYDLMMEFAKPQPTMQFPRLLMLSKNIG